MKNLRAYGKPPFKIAVIHGGPGAVGEMAPVARELAPAFGVLEPMQVETTLERQVESLKTLLVDHADPPVTLIGFSWGAWLSFIVAARYPGIIARLILVGSGPFEHHYLAQIQETRMSRLPADERFEYNSIITALNDPHAEGKSKKFARLGQLALKTDCYDADLDDPPMDPPEPGKSETNQGNIYHQVLMTAQEMRKSGELLALADHIQCPVLALHGDYDPHPAAGVFEPLTKRLKDFRFIGLEKCGHKPWIERQAKQNFYQILRRELYDK